MESIIDTCLLARIKFHYVFHWFHTGGGTGTATATMDIKLAQELSSVYQDPLFLIFLKVRKAYDRLDRGCLIRTLEG